MYWCLGSIHDVPRFAADVYLRFCHNGCVHSTRQLLHVRTCVTGNVCQFYSKTVRQTSRTPSAANKDWQNNFSCFTLTCSHVPSHLTLSFLEPYELRVPLDDSCVLHGCGQIGGSQAAWPKICPTSFHQHLPKPLLGTWGFIEVYSWQPWPLRFGSAKAATQSMRHPFYDVLCGKVQVCGFFVACVEKVPLCGSFASSPLVIQNMSQRKHHILYNMAL